MMFLFGGIPDIYYEKFKVKAKIELSGHFFTGAPLAPRGGGSYYVDDDHCSDLISALISFVSGRQSALDDGLAVVLLLRPWEKNAASDFFFPFAIFSEIHTGERPARGGVEASIVCNKQIRLALDEAKRLIRPANAIRTELQTRLKRTPILLPIRHFGSDELLQMLLDIYNNLKGGSNFSQLIAEKCADFESVFPYQKAGGKQGRFTNRRGVDFTMPGRALHGDAHLSEGNGHNNKCFLNGKLRLGGPVSSGFHYDCRCSDSVYSGVFCNCHDAEGGYKGRPHLNVYPSDYIRE